MRKIQKKHGNLTQTDTFFSKDKVSLYFPIGNLQMLIVKSISICSVVTDTQQRLENTGVQKGYARALSGEWLMGLSVCGALGLPASSLPFSVPREKSGWDRSSVSSKLSVGSCRSNIETLKRERHSQHIQQHILRLPCNYRHTQKCLFPSCPPPKTCTCFVRSSHKY